jgi:hypothetical protein
MKARAAWLIFVMFVLIAATIGAAGQEALAPPPKNWTAAEDHQNMMAQLGIRALRPGPSGNESAPNHANYDEATANPYPNLPDPLTLRNGARVTTSAAGGTRVVPRSSRTSNARYSDRFRATFRKSYGP